MTKQINITDEMIEKARNMLFVENVGCNVVTTYVKMDGSYEMILCHDIGAIESAHGVNHGYNKYSAEYGFQKIFFVREEDNFYVVYPH